MNRLRIIFASSWGAIVAIAFVIAITIWMEFSPALKAWLVSIAGHHWTTKSILTMLIWIIVMKIMYFAKPNPSDDRIRNSLKTLTFVAIAGALIIFGFFFLHYVG